MSEFDSVDCLARFRRATRTVAGSASFPTDADAYQYLTEGAIAVENRLSSLVPKLNVTAPFLMATEDGGKTFNFRQDTDNNFVIPLGNVEIFPSLGSIPYYPLIEYFDYLVEGNKIRIPQNGTRTFVDGAPYARFWAPTLKITASVQPLLQPVQARVLVILEAVKRYASESKDLGGMYELACSRLEGSGNEPGEWLPWIQRLRSEWMQEGTAAAWVGMNSDLPGRWSVDSFRYGPFGLGGVL